MPRYSKNFLRWADVFERSVSGPPRDEEGMGQFHNLESSGIRPQKPTPYFTRLDCGRSMFNALQKQVRETYGTEEWQGIAHDRIEMPDWYFRAFYGWHPSIKG